MAASNPVTIVPAPSDSPATPYIHRVSGSLIFSRIVAFIVSADGNAEPVMYPRPGEGWGEIIDLQNGYVSAFGRQARNATGLSNAIRAGRPQ